MSKVFLGANLILACCFGQANVWAEFRQGDSLTPTDLVEVISLRLTVAPGADLHDPVALDLGLGFPFWLHPVGRSESALPPFGTVPQEATATVTVPAGKTVEFTFCRTGSPGRDPLVTSQQLLSDVRIADIAQIGFAGQAKKPWKLKGYEIRVNGRLLAANDAVDAAAPVVAIEEKPSSTSEAQKATIRQKIADLKALIEAGLASQDDRQQLPKWESQLKAADGKSRLTPWYIEAAWKGIGRQPSTVKSLRATVWTQSETAVVENYVYLGVGGHKYLLFSPENPLRGSAEPQTVEIDTQTGPLTASDLRGFSLGVVANSRTQGPKPAELRHRRLKVEVDGM